jgi:hypothetical protein
MIQGSKVKRYFLYLLFQNKTDSGKRLNDKKLNDTAFQYSDLLLQSPAPVSAFCKKAAAGYLSKEI